MKPHQPSTKFSCSDEADAAVERQDWKQAVEQHEALLKKTPDNCLAIYHLGYIWGKMGDRHKETDFYLKAVKCGYNTDDNLYFNLAMAYGDLGKFSEAIASFERAISLNPKGADNYFGLGLMTQAQGQTLKAQNALQKAVLIDFKHWEARILLTQILLDQGQLNAAADHLQLLEKEMPENEEVAELKRIYDDRRITSYDQ